MRRLLISAPGRLALSVALGGVVLGAVTLLGIHIVRAIMAAIGAAGLFFVVAGIAVMWPMDAHQTRRNARREDFRPAVDEAVIVVAALGAVVGMVGLVMLGGNNAGAIEAILALVGVFFAWASLHVMYAAHYAYMHYDDDDIGIDFNSSSPPSYQDFLYMSFAIGMTYGVTDTTVTTTQVRAVVLRHGLQSFVFGVLILATGINLVTQVFLS